MHQSHNVSVSLSKAQTAQVIRDATGGDEHVTEFFSRMGDLDGFSSLVSAGLEDPHLSHSTLRALLVLAAFPADGGDRSLGEVARLLDYSPSTAHRYVTTWMALGFLEQDPSSRRYRRAML